MEEQGDGTSWWQKAGGSRFLGGGGGRSVSTGETGAPSNCGGHPALASGGEEGN